MDGEGPQPFEHFIGRLSEEFGGALPDAVFECWQRMPIGFMERLIEYRAYAATKAAKDRHDNPTATSELWQLVTEIEHEIATEDIRSRSEGP